MIERHWEFLSNKNSSEWAPQVMFFISMAKLKKYIHITKVDKAKQKTCFTKINEAYKSRLSKKIQLPFTNDNFQANTRLRHNIIVISSRSTSYHPSDYPHFLVTWLCRCLHPLNTINHSSPHHVSHTLKTNKKKTTALSNKLNFPNPLPPQVLNWKTLTPTLPPHHINRKHNI